MAKRNRMIVHKIFRLTLVRKGRAMAKHVDMRHGVVEKVAAVPVRPTTFDAVFDRIMDVDAALGIRRPPQHVDLPEGVTFDDAVKRLLHS